MPPMITVPVGCKNFSPTHKKKISKSLSFLALTTLRGRFVYQELKAQLFASPLPPFNELIRIPRHVPFGRFLFGLARYKTVLLFLRRPCPARTGAAALARLFFRTFTPFDRESGF